MVTQVSVDHFFAGRARERPLQIVNNAVPGPKGEGAGPGVGLASCELGDERVVRVHGSCQMADKCMEKLFASAVNGPLDDRTERSEFFVHFARQVISFVGSCSSRGCFYGSLVRVGHGHLPDGERRNLPSIILRIVAQKPQTSHG
jgi:hypothetical protein